MAKKDIFCIGIDIPGDEFQFFPYDSGISLLDADIILFQLGMDYSINYAKSPYEGKPLLSAESSDENFKIIRHWNEQLLRAFVAGKTIFIFLTAPVEVFAYSGTQSVSGTGRNQKVTKHVKLIDSHMTFPLEFDSKILGRGKKIRLTKEGRFITSYWQAIKNISSYEISYEIKSSTPLMVTESGNNIVASLLCSKSNNILLLPPVDFSRDDFKYYDPDLEQDEWTNEALKYGKSFLKSIIEIHTCPKQVLL